MSPYHFPRWTDALRPVLGIAAILVPTYVIVLVAYGASAENLNVGYAPEQPVPFSHRVHAGQLGLDCRYCHFSVENDASAAVPPTSVCGNCHGTDADGVPKLAVHPDSLTLAPVQAALDSGDPVEWVRVHDLGEYAYFNHSAHFSAGVGCAECHGRVDTMDVVTQIEPLSMAWCIECHRAPEARLRPREFVTDLTWGLDMSFEERFELGKRLRAENNINPRTDCSTCHR